MSKKKLEEIMCWILGILLTIFGDVTLILVGMWPIAILISAIVAIYPTAVILDKIGIIELVNVKKTVDENGNVLYEEYESTNKKSSANNYDRQLRYEEDIKRANILFGETFKKPAVTEKTRKEVLKHPQRYTSCDARTRMGKFYTDEEYKKLIEKISNMPLSVREEKGPTLVKRRKQNKPLS